MRTILIAWLSVLAGSALAQTANAPRSLVGSDRWTAAGPQGGITHVETAKAAAHGAGIKITVDRAVEPFYYAQVVQPLADEVAGGERIRLSFWAKSPDRHALRAVIEKTDAPFTAVAEWSGALEQDWTFHSATGVSQGFGPGGLTVRLQVGQSAGQLELASIRVERLGPDPALAAARSALTPAAIRARIRRYRTGELVVRVVDRKGKPVPNAKVHVEMTRHAFLFGCNIFGLQPANESAAQKAYQVRFTGLFNYATLPFYWGAFEPQAGHPEYARLDAMADWCASHGLTTKGHPLVWHEVWPAWAPKTADDSIPLLQKRVGDIVAHYRVKVGYWDVVNEANASQNYPKTGVGDWARRDGAAELVRTALGWARKAAGDAAELIYNDFDTTEKNVELLSELRRRRSLPDAIGIQSHMHGGEWPLEQVWATVERFAPFGRPIHFTETTVISGERKSFEFANPPASWPSTPEGERKQADYVAQFYSALFSHPSVRAITWWDLSDAGAWLNAPAGLVRADMSPKAAYTRLQQLIRHEWWTDATMTSGGGARVRAFYGDYRITVTDSRGRSVSQKVQFPMGLGSKTVVVRLP